MNTTVIGPLAKPVDQLKALMRRNITALALLFALFACQAEATPQRIEIAPSASEIGFRAYKLGLLPIDGKFTRFAGWLTFDPGDRTSCRVELRVEVASLQTDDPSVLPVVTGPDFMDTANFPLLQFAGRCTGREISGMLAMHGVSHNCSLSLDWRPDEVVAEGHIVRADWGISAMPLLAGKTVRIRVSVPLAAQPSHGG
jgi:polyisoprenoid-binding protein YceI